MKRNSYAVSQCLVLFTQDGPSPGNEQIHVMHASRAIELVICRVQYDFCFISAIRTGCSKRQHRPGLTWPKYLVCVPTKPYLTSIFGLYPNHAVPDQQYSARSLYQLYHTWPTYWTCIPTKPYLASIRGPYLNHIVPDQTVLGLLLTKNISNKFWNNF